MILSKWASALGCAVVLWAGCSSAPSTSESTSPSNDGGVDRDGLVGNTVSDGSGSVSVEGGSVTDLCTRITTAMCDHTERCGCNATMVASCRASLANCANPTPGLFGSAGAELTYHPEALDPVLAHLASPSASCDALFLDLGLDSVSVSSWGGALTGTRQVGEACSSPVGTKGGVSDCKEGSLCIRSATGQNRCVALVALGGECDVGPDPARMCFDRRPPDSDDEFESAFDALMCIPTASGSKVGTCRTGLDDGLPCLQDESCKSGRCVSTGVNQGICSPKQPAGGTCDTGADCQTGGCAKSVCGPLLADGTECSYDNKSCASGLCRTPDDQSSGTSPGTCGPKENKAVGATCAQSYECATRTCRSNMCVERICKR